MTAFAPDLFRLPVVELAERLVGATFLVDGVGGMVVETEAYRADEAASHSHRGLTPRNAAMFGPVGRLYIYRSYGLHWCVNLVGGEAPGAAVLIRALEPTTGLDPMAARRGVTDPRQLCSGPGKLAAALGVTRALDGSAVNQGGIALIDRTAEPAVVRGPRVGISRAADLPWRFGLAGSRFLSRPFAGRAP